MEHLAWVSDRLWEQLSANADSGVDRWTRVESADGLFEHLEGAFCGVVLLESTVVDPPVGRVISTVRTRCPEAAIHVVLGQPFVDRAAGLMRAGASDVTTAPLDEDDLERSARSAELGAGVGDPEEIDTDVLLEAARRSIRADNYERAHGLLRQTLAADLGNPEAFNLLGVTAEIRGDTDSAQKYYRAAIDLAPPYQPARTNLKRATTHDDHRPPDLGDAETNDGEST